MINVKSLEPFKILYNLPPKTNLVICIGGRGGGKSWEVSKFITYSATIKKKRCAILRDEKATIRESILNEIFNRYDTANVHGHFDGLYAKIETGIRDNKSSNMLVYTKGFRASSKDKKSNLKGMSDTDIAVVEEAEDIRSFEKFNTMRDSIRTKDRLIIVLLNTPDINHWIVQRYFNLELVEDGYWRLIPKKIEGFVCIQTTYKDNPYLPEDVAKDYEGSGNPEHHRYDPHYYKTQILGYASSGRKGQILTKVKRISLEEYLNLDYKEYYGLDFGTASPAGIVGVKVHRNAAYIRQLNYKPMNILEIGKFLCEKGFTGKDIIVADSANPLDIGKLRSGWRKEELSPEDIKKYPQLLKGFFVLAALKPHGSVNAGISIMKSMELYAVDESKDLWNEIYNYIYAVDKNENPTDDPIDEFNHLIDPTRYVITGKGKIF